MNVVDECNYMLAPFGLTATVNRPGIGRVVDIIGQYGATRLRTVWYGPDGPVEAKPSEVYRFVKEAVDRIIYDTNNEQYDVVWI